MQKPTTKLKQFAKNNWTNLLTYLCRRIIGNSRHKTIQINEEYTYTRPIATDVRTRLLLILKQLASYIIELYTYMKIFYKRYLHINSMSSYQIYK